MQCDYDFIVLDEQRKPNVYAISSICEDGKHIIIWDFDMTHDPKMLYNLEKILKSVQRQFLLSKIYLLHSRAGYNAVCLDKLDKNEVANIKHLTLHDDKKHLEQGIMYNWKLRIGSDKKLMSIIDVCGFNKYTQSNSHRLAMCNLYGIDISKNIYFDESSKLCLYSYWDWKVAAKNGEL
jgi:hypothetical protein